MSIELKVFDDFRYDETIIKEEIHTYLPYGSRAYGLSDEIRIQIQNQELITNTRDSYIYIAGLLNSDNAAQTCDLTNNFPCFLFEEIRYELGGQKVDVCRLPGITSAIKSYVSYTPNESKALSLAGWAPKDDDSIQIQHVINDLQKSFTACIPLKHIFGFAEMYKKPIINMRQELILIRSRTDKDCYNGGANGTITITDISWKVSHITLSDEAKLNLYNSLNKNSPVTIAFRQWELYKLPALKTSKIDIWSIKTSFGIEKPQWVLVAFQHNQENNKEVDASKFKNLNITNLTLNLNSEKYPYEHMHLDFENDKYIPAYINYIQFQNSYYEKNSIEPLFDYEEYKKNPVFVIDCSKQNETLKNSMVDVKLEMEALQKFEAESTAFCLILHDTIIQYNPSTGEVRRI